MKPDFPIFHHRPELVYLDTAATAQKPKVVLEAMNEFYEKHNANINRGAHFLGEESTQAYHAARQTVANFIHAQHPHEIIFTRNATESINLVAKSWGEAFLEEGDEILLSKLEHHSNLVPWLQLKAKKGIELQYFDLDPHQGIVFDPNKITKKIKLVAISGMSNVLGTITDLKPMIQTAHQVGAKVLVDACQLAVHSPIDVQGLDVDFLVFSGHKLYGPTGIGILYGKTDLLQAMPPFLGGGDMIQEVFLDRFTPAGLPEKFEAGTPNIAGAIGLKAALDYLGSIGWDKIEPHERALTEYALEQLKMLPFLQLVGPQTMKNRGSVLSFTVDKVHPHDLAEGLSQQGLCLRSGHHCCQVLMDTLGLPATARISLGIYNERQDIDKAVEALKKVYDYFA